MMSLMRTNTKVNIKTLEELPEEPEETSARLTKETPASGSDKEILKSKRTMTEVKKESMSIKQVGSDD